MLERIAPHLAMIGIHKNGTWAAQKIIECVQSPEEVSLIGQYLRPYVPPLLLDQFGNYVVQSVVPLLLCRFISNGLIGAASASGPLGTNSSLMPWSIDCGRSLKVALVLVVCGLAWKALTLPSTNNAESVLRSFSTRSHLLPTRTVLCC